jgi:hypothetical protein
MISNISFKEVVKAVLKRSSVEGTLLAPVQAE